MYPTIHHLEAENLDTRGLGSLSDCLSCEVTEELNGAYTLEMKYPLHGRNAEHLIAGNVIMARPNHVHADQPFRIRQVKRALGNTITVYANHISYDLSGYPYNEAVELSGLANVISALNDKVASLEMPDIPYHAFAFETDITDSAVFTSKVAQSIKAWMSAMVGLYGGEWIYDRFDCEFASRRGRDTNVRISYGRNLAEYTKEQNDSTYSHVCAYYDKNDQPLFSHLVETGVYCAFRVLYVNMTNKFNDATPNVNALDNLAEEYASTLDSRTQTITVAPVQLGTEIGLGDSVLVCYDNVFETRVVKAKWDVLANRYTSLELGTKKDSIADTIKSVSSSGESLKVKAKQYSGTLNTYGCIQTDLKPETVVISAKTVTGTSFECTPLIAGGYWWIRAVDWVTGNKGSGSITVTVNYF